ncbi:MAG: flagellar export chaperone FliS [Candidatus Hydrogenedentes bacterium]|nr:flagellar export chaperone FliS [Candidatus Hydrogenedentota bacterium]
MPSSSAADFDTYRTVNVETAPQAKLIIMLYNGAIQRAEEGKRQIEKGKLQDAHNNLLRAQDIIAELRGSLNMRAGAVAENLNRIYEYFQHLLVTANIRKETQPIEECIALLISMRDTWQELFDRVAKEDRPQPAPAQNQHGGAGLINIQG